MTYPTQLFAPQCVVLHYALCGLGRTCAVRDPVAAVCNDHLAMQNKARLCLGAACYAVGTIDAHNARAESESPFRNSVLPT